MGWHFSAIRKSSPPRLPFALLSVIPPVGTKIDVADLESGTWIRVTVQTGGSPVRRDRANRIELIATGARNDLVPIASRVEPATSAQLVLEGQLNFKHFGRGGIQLSVVRTAYDKGTWRLEEQQTLATLEYDLAHGPLAQGTVRLVSMTPPTGARIPVEQLVKGRRVRAVVEASVYALRSKFASNVEIIVIRKTNAGTSWPDLSDRIVIAKRADVGAPTQMVLEGTLRKEHVSVDGRIYLSIVRSTYEKATNHFVELQEFISLEYEAAPH